MRGPSGQRVQDRGMRAVVRQIAIPFVVLLVLRAPPTAAQTGVALSADNDYFNFWEAAHRRSDVDYTQGVDLTVRWPGRLPHVLRWLGRGSPCQPATPVRIACTRLGVSLGQQVYTPWYDAALLSP